MFIWMLHMFHTYVASFYMDVAYVLQMVFRCFFQVFHMHVLSVSYVFRHMLQVLHWNVSKVNRAVAHGRAWEAGGGTSRPRAWPDNMGDVRDGTDPLYRHHPTLAPRIGRPSASKELTMEQLVSILYSRSLVYMKRDHYSN